MPGSKSSTQDNEARVSKADIQSTKAIQFFIDTCGKLPIILNPITPLGRKTGSSVSDNSNYLAWKVSVIFLLRQYEVYCILHDGFDPLPESDHLYLWYNRMTAIVSSVIWANLSKELQNDVTIQLWAMKTDVRKFWFMLAIIYGDYDDEVLNEFSDCKCCRLAAGLT
jgi:hypothetical protein